MLIFISKIIRKINDTAVNANEVDTGSIEYMKVSFLHEVWMSEHPTDLSEGATMEIALDIMEGNLNEVIPLKLSKTLTNLNVAMKDFDKEVPRLTMDMICQCNRLVSEGLFDCGIIRSVELGAAKTNILYVKASKINDMLITLRSTSSTSSWTITRTI